MASEAIESTQKAAQRSVPRSDTPRTRIRVQSHALGGLCFLLCLVSCSAFQPLLRTTRLCRSTFPSRHVHFALTQPADDSPDPVQSAKALDDLVHRSNITALVQSKSNTQGILQVAWHFFLFGLASIVRPRPLCMVARAYVSSFFFHGLHECVHRTAFFSKWLNDTFAHLFGILTFRPARHYFYYHWQHHKHTGNPELDSELQPGSFLDFPVTSFPRYLLYLSGIPFWIDAFSSLVRHAAGQSPEAYLLNGKSRQEVTREARIYLVLYGGLTVLGTTFGFTSKLWQFWLLPALLGQPFLRFYLLAEHRGRKQNPAAIWENTRTMQTNWFYRKLAWSMPYHMEHHAWPSVPFYRLPEAHQLLLKATDGSASQLLEQGDEIDVGRNGYIRFHWSFLKHLFKSSNH